MDNTQETKSFYMKVGSSETQEKAIYMGMLNA